MNVNLYILKDYDNKTALRLEQNKPKQSQFLLPPKPPILSQNNSPFTSSLLTNNPPQPPALAIGFSSFIHINSALCLFYHFGCLRHLIQLWDLEQFATLAAVYPSVSGTTFKHPGTATRWALSDNLHRYIPYANPQDTLWWRRILNNSEIRPSGNWVMNIRKPGYQEKTNLTLYSGNLIPTTY